MLKHPEYSPRTMKYDFAILTLDEPVRDEFASIVLSAGADEEVGQKRPSLAGARSNKMAHNRK